MNNSYYLFSEPKIAFQDIFDELKKATQSIYIESFLLDDDKIGRKLISILRQKAKHIPVTVLIDDYGFKNPSEKMLETLTNSKINFSLFNPIRQVIRRGKFAKWFQDMRVRNHRKVTLIDNTIAYVGGMNYSARELTWRDVMVKMTGHIVSDIKLAAAEMREIHYNHQWLHRSINKKLTKKKSICRQIPYSKHRPLLKRVNKLIHSAKKEILITTPYFVPDFTFLNKLRLAVKRKVDVKLLVPIKSDHYYADILTDFFIGIAHNIGIKVYLMNKISHAKYMVVDNKVCTFGSANFDYQAFHKNYELNIFSEEDSLVSELKELFESDMSKAKQFTPLLKRNTTIIRRFLEKILYRFKEQF